MAMSKLEMRTRLKLKRRAFETITETHPICEVGTSGQLWEMCLDNVDEEKRRIMQRY